MHFPDSWSVDKLLPNNVFQLKLSLVICIEGDCIETALFDQIRFPIPTCDPTPEITLPGWCKILLFLNIFFNPLRKSKAVDNFTNCSKIDLLYYSI